jgi:hypothetical protein
MTTCIRCSIAVSLILVAGLALAGEPEAKRGPEVLSHFKRDLKEALRAGLSKGPAEAVTTCQLEAPGIADGLSKQAVRVGRTSHRLRNPANVSPAWVSPILADYLADAAHRTPRTVGLPEGRSGYVEPILAQPLCLTCHGTAIAPDVAARIAALYPDDEATGFEAGDLRGVFWVELPGPK